MAASVRHLQCIIAANIITAVFYIYRRSIRDIDDHAVPFLY